MSSALRHRPAAAADLGFLRQVYAGTRAAELRLTGWTAAQCDAFVAQQFDAQWRHYNAHWPQAEHLIVQAAQGEAWCDVGRLWIDRSGPGWHVLDIALLPECCGQGLGGACLRALQGDAAQAGQALSLQVEDGNPARRLYERLGFRADGPVQGIHQRMVWRPEADGATTHTTTDTLEYSDEQA